MKAQPVVLLMILGFMLGGCASATPVEDAPLEADEESQLECLVVGTWFHQSSDGTPLQRAAQNMYHLDEDGTGHIEPNEGSQAMFGMPSSITDFEWELEGRNLHLHREDDQTDVFRVDDWSADEMIWFYYNNSMDYGVGRDSDAEIPDC